MIKHLFVILVLCLSGTGAYISTLEYPFAFDDIPNIVENYNIRLQQFDRESVRKAMHGLRASRPVANFSFGLNYYISEFDVKGFRLTNIIIHLINGILCYIFVYLIIYVAGNRQPIQGDPQPEADSPTGIATNRAYYIAFLTAIIWLLHPIQSQSVIYIVQRMNSLAVLFYLLAFCLYIAGRILKPLVIKLFFFTCALVSFGLAMGSKEVAGMLPVSIMAFELCFFQNLNRRWLAKNIRTLIIAGIFITCSCLVFLGSNPIARIQGTYSNRDFGMMERVLTEFRIIIFYFTQLLYPLPERFNLDHHFIVSKTVFTPGTLLSIAILALLLTLSVRLYRRHRVISFCLLWIFIHLVVESTVIGLELVFEHRLYLPSIGFILLLVWMYDRIIPTKLAPRIVALIFVPGLLLYATTIRASVWKDNLSLWTDCVNKSPDKARPHLSIGAELARQGKTDEAIRHYKKVLEIQPHFPKCHDNLGLALMDKGLIDEAIYHHRQAVKYGSNYWIAYVNLALALASKGNHEEAVKYYKSAIRMNKTYYVANINMGQSLMVLGRADEAVKNYLRAIEIEPNRVEGYIGLGMAYGKLGKDSKAVQQYKKALALDPSSVKTIFNLANRLKEQGKHRDAIENYEKVLGIKPNYADAHFQMATSWKALGKNEEAITSYTDTIRLNPGHWTALYGRGLTYHHGGNLDLAVADYLKALEAKPRNADIHNNLGAAYFQLQKFDDALVHYNEAVTIQPNLSQSYFNMGMIYEGRKQFTEALDHYDRALKINPKYKKVIQAKRRVKSKM